MMVKGLFIQVSMIVLSVAIIMTYVQPKFLEVAGLQDDVALYQEQQKKIVSVNSSLSSKVSKLRSVSADDMRRLRTYLPDEIDSVSVTRDLYLITQAAGVNYVDASYAAPGRGSSNRSSQTETSDNLPIPHQFSLSVEGSYEQIKNLFNLLEQNQYPLMVESATLDGGEDDRLTAAITLVTYTYKRNASNDSAATSQVTF